MGYYASNCYKSNYYASQYYGRSLSETLRAFNIALGARQSIFLGDTRSMAIGGEDRNIKVCGREVVSFNPRATILLTQNQEMLLTANNDIMLKSKQCIELNENETLVLKDE